MKSCKPVRTTIVYGILCGLLYMPLTMLLMPLFSWSVTFCLIIWLYLAIYALLLAGWGRKSPARIIFPLLLLLAGVFLSRSITTYVLLAMAILSWIRSGICFPGNVFMMLGAEIMVCLGGGALAAFFSPHSALSIALGVWLFILTQAIYFVFFRRDALAEDKKVIADLFEQARKQAEKIVSEDLV